MKCVVCDTNNPSFSWTDYHGIAQCSTCGTPYRLYHYDDKNKRVDKPPESLVKPEWIPLLRRYHEETRRIIPGGFSFFPGGQELATRDDIRAWNDWCERNEAELPNSKDVPKAMSR